MSTSNYPFLLNNGAIFWSSKKQSCIALSTLESEYVDCSTAIQEGVWLRRLIAELGITAHASEPVTIRYDNMTVLAYAKDLKYHGIKHIDIQYLFIHMVVERGSFKAHFYESHDY